jgi:hypothetical protein
MHGKHIDNNTRNTDNNGQLSYEEGKQQPTGRKPAGK